jgi:hypothetical protein
MNSRVRRRSCSLLALVAAVFTTAASPAAEPSKVDCLTASEAWLKLRSEGKLRDARTQLLVCAAASCPADVRDECSSHIAAVNAAIPSIVFMAKDAAGSDVAAVTVTMDGQWLASKLDGSAIAIDPGEHTFTFETAGQAPFARKFVIHEGEKDRRETIVVGAAAGPAIARSAAAPTSTRAENPVPLRHSASDGLGGGRTVALALGGAGLAGLVAGSAFGLDASSKWSRAQRTCGGGCSPDSPAQQEKHDAQDAATAATIAFAGAGAALAAGVVLWLTAPASSGAVGRVTVRVTPSAGFRKAGFELTGMF